ncbi:MAG: hypothetical protein HQL08_07830 [Nitrospirae bacterium]|nr:hypothetical protein [Nitrospirota bacterium]
MALNDGYRRQDESSYRRADKCVRYPDTFPEMAGPTLTVFSGDFSLTFKKDSGERATGLLKFVISDRSGFDKTAGLVYLPYFQEKTNRTKNFAFIAGGELLCRNRKGSEGLINFD